MKKLIVNAACFAFIGLGFLSCQKETVQPLESSTLQKSNYQSKDANFVNPYEFVGEVHNIALERARQARVDNPNLKADEIYFIIRQTVTNELTIRGYATEEIIETDPEFLASLQNINTEEDWAEMLVDMDKAQKQVMTKFEQDILNYINHGNLDLAISGMKNLENQVDNNPKIAGDDKIMILSMLALGRHSFMYWAEKDQENPEAAYIGNGSWRADIRAFRKDWKQHSNNPAWTLRARWDSAIGEASTESDLAGQNGSN